MLTSYRRLLALAGPAYVVVAFLGRLPLAMSQMGTLLLVATSTGSYAAGGLTAGALAVSNAVLAPVAGSLADRVGQRPVVLVQSLVGGVGLVVLVALTGGGSSVPVLVLAAAVAGGFLPQVGPLARVRWRPILRRGTGAAEPRLVEAAFSYESAADEASFVLGPALLGALIALADPGAALVTAAGLLIAFGGAFALHPTARLTHQHHQTGGADGALVTLPLVVLMVAQLMIGVLFGSVQTGTSALATSQGHPGAAGVVHAVLGVGSAAAALAVAGLPARIPFAARMLAAATGMLLLSTPLLLVDSLTALVPVVLVLGFVLAPYMISNFMMAERASPPHRVAAAMTLLAGATGLGYALGAGVAGRLADAGGHGAAFAVTVAATGAAAVLALAAQPMLRRLGP